MLRFVLAFFLTPIFLVIIYYLGYTLLAVSAGTETPSATAFGFGLFPIAYISTAVFLLPIVFFLEKKRLRGLRHYAIAGGIIGLILDFVLLGLATIGSWEPELFVILVAVVLFGGLCTCAFWTIALFQATPNQ